MKIGITEQGDGALDLSWSEKLNKVDGAVIISKGFNDRFKTSLLLNKDKIIYHATVTGLAQSILEPNVISVQNMIKNISGLISDGFDPTHIVIRIDPIISKRLYSNIFNKDFIDYRNQIKMIIDQFYSIGVRRFRYSFIDLYPHVLNRFKNAGISVENISFANHEYADWAVLFRKIENTNRDVSFECCAETEVLDYHKIGCISTKDLKLLNIDFSSTKIESKQRPLCLCLSGKTELLTKKHRCKHNCLYCYWKD